MEGTRGIWLFDPYDALRSVSPSSSLPGYTTGAPIYPLTAAPPTRSSRNHPRTPHHPCLSSSSSRPSPSEPLPKPR